MEIRIKKDYSRVIAARKCQLVETVICSRCYVPWQPDNSKPVLQACPNCGQIKDCRDRYEQYKRRIDKILQTDPQFFKKIQAISERNKPSDPERIGTITKIRISAMMVIGKGVIKCSNCPCDDIRLIEINHITGGSYQQFKSKGVLHRDNNVLMYYRIATGKEDPKKFNLKCRVCNILDHLEKKFGKLPFTIMWKGEEYGG